MSSIKSLYFDVMLQKATMAMHHAYAKYSNFQVGACIRTPDHSFFYGCNVENSSYPMTQCAEASAIGNMVSNGHLFITEILIVANSDVFCPPCGACRQKISEFSNPHTLVHMCNRQHDVKTMTMEALLPMQFDSTHFMTTQGNDSQQ